MLLKQIVRHRRVVYNPPRHGRLFLDTVTCRMEPIVLSLCCLTRSGLTCGWCLRSTALAGHNTVCFQGFNSWEMSEVQCATTHSRQGFEEHTVLRTQCLRSHLVCHAYSLIFQRSVRFNDKSKTQLKIHFSIKDCQAWSSLDKELL